MRRIVKGFVKHRFHAAGLHVDAYFTRHFHALTIYDSRPGADQQRKLVAGALAGELGADHSDELKAFLCRQLQLCADGDQIPTLARLLADDRLCEPATQALLAIGCGGALAALEKALPDAESDRRVTISQAVDILSGK